MPDTDAGERVTPVLDFPTRDGLAVHAVPVDYQPGGFPRVHRHPGGAYVSRNASPEMPASFVAFFVLGDGEDQTVEDA